MTNEEHLDNMATTNPGILVQDSTQYRMWLLTETIKNGQRLSKMEAAMHTPDSCVVGKKLNWSLTLLAGAIPVLLGVVAWLVNKVA